LNRDNLQPFIDQPLAFEPGTMTLYSNPGYVVLGAIIESVSGKEYSAYVRRHIHEPAGMNQTDWPTPDALKIAVGFTWFNAPPTGVAYHRAAVQTCDERGTVCDTAFGRARRTRPAAE
jgi:CubicO group peptidase (beta-lactamase class C family)